MLSYTGLSNNLLIVTIAKAFFKLRLSCAEIEVYHNVCHHTFSEIYCTDAVCSILDLHRKFVFLNFEIYYLRALRLLNSSMSLSSSLET